MKFFIRLVLGIGFVACTLAQSAQPPSPGSFITIGDAGVPLMFVPWGSPLLSNLQQAGLTALQYEQQQLATMLQASATYGLQGVQYYLGWGVAEPKQDQWDWAQYRLDAQAIKARGLEFIPYGWIQNLPTWVRNDPAYPRATNVDTSLETDSLSIYAPETKAAYSRFYSHLKSDLGTYIDKLRFASPYDFGECAYPGGVADFVFPLKNSAPGFWVGEAVARDHFRAAMQTKYGSLANLNAAWGTAFTAFSSLPYPSNTTKRRYWLDFIDWYHTGNTEKIGELIDVIRGYFPTTLTNINIGYPYEKLNVGQDISGLVKMTAQKGNMSVCSGTGNAVPFINSKRVSTALRFYGGRWLASETTGSNETLPGIAKLYFKALSDGVNWPFSYGGNLVTGATALSQFREIGSSVSDHQARIDVAVFFPTTSHRLDDWDSWRQPGASGGYPGNLQPLCDQIRDVCDYGVIDERMIGDGALYQYKILYWPVGTVAEAQTMTAISAWVQNGGVLLALDFAAIRDVDGNPGAFAALTALPKVGDMRVAGQGFIFDAAGDLAKLNVWIVQRGSMQPLNSSYPAKISTLPVLDNASNGVLTTEFTNGVLLFNSTASAVTVTLPALDGQGAAQPIAVPSLALRWVDRITQVPTITLFTPTSAPAGATVTITGTNLSGVTAVKFNGTAANIISNTTTQVAVTVPAEATSGTISVTIAGGTATSTTTFTSSIAPQSRLTNLSVRTNAGAGNQTLIAGFVISGTASKPLLVRGVGPALGQFGIPGFLADPVLSLFNGSGAVIAQNDNWGDNANAGQIDTTSSRLGAFALTANSKDAVLLSSLSPGGYTAQITGVIGAAGVSLAEIYDANQPADVNPPTLVNVSARTQVETGANILIAGFAISGGFPKQLLIRGVGPSLSQFGVPAVLADPQLQLFDRGGTIVAQNDNWGDNANAPQILTQAQNVGAFALPPGSKDAVLLITLSPGSYTAQVSGVGGATGVALVEVYDAP